LFRLIVTSLLSVLKIIVIIVQASRLIIVFFNTLILEKRRFDNSKIIFLQELSFDVFWNVKGLTKTVRPTPMHTRERAHTCIG
jgi:hypothetical protein